MLRTTSIEGWSETADRYFQQVLANPDQLLAKPAANVTEAPELLIAFGTLLRGLKPLPGARVLDFGAGTCWTSRFLAQLGCDVIAMDISPAALEIGKLSFQRSPQFGLARVPEFMIFDGTHIDLDDDSIDAVVCFDAFHHVPNPQTVLAEMARVLVPGGRAGFSEPGPRHSLLPQSQFEMRNFGVLENNVVMDDIATWANKSGFDDIQMAIFDANTFWCSLPDFESFLQGRPSSLPDHLRISLRNRRMFVLKKTGEVLPDSRDGSRLRCDLDMTELNVDRAGLPDRLVVTGVCHATNTGTSLWLASEAKIGGVRLGRRNGPGQVTRDLDRFAVPGEGVAPGDSRTFPSRWKYPKTFQQSQRSSHSI